MALEMQKISGNRAVKILEDMFAALVSGGNIDPQDMTTFELNFLRRVCKHSEELRKLPTRGIEEKLL